MKTNTKNIAWLLLASLPALGILPQSQADELSELYLGTSSNNSESDIPPNILVIIDTSGSMKNPPGFAINPLDFYDDVPYDSTVTYPGECDPDHVYRRSVVVDDDGNQLLDEFGYPIDADGISRFQSCGSPQFGFSKTTFVCKTALDDLEGTRGWWWGGISEFRPAKWGHTYTKADDNPTVQYTGFYYVENGSEVPDDYEVPIDESRPPGADMDGEWHSLSSHVATLDEYNGQKVWRDCPQDIGAHGWSDATSEVWPTDETTHGYRGTADTGESSAVQGVAKHVIAAGNFLNWYEYTQTRLAAVQIAIREIVRGLPTGTRIGLMRFDSSATNDSTDQTQGGMMIKEFVGAGEGTNTEDFVDALFDIKPWQGSGTPLSESLLEAVYAYRGEQVKFGDISTIQDQDGNRIDLPSVPASRQSSNPADAAYGYYQTPIQYECQKNSVILLSDGDPTSDGEVWWNPGDGRNLHNFTNYSPDNCGTECLPYLAEYLANEDLSSIAGDQTVTTHTVGFGSELTLDGQNYLREAAENGEGSFTMANSFDDLRNAFQVIFRTEIAENQSLSSPAVTVNAFNRLAHQDELYFTLFNPAFNALHWPGNLKKYKLKKQSDGAYRLVDVNDSPALVDDSSDIAFDALSYWTDTSDPDVIENDGRDGDKTPIGGAAGKLTDTHLATRKIYSWYGDSSPALLTDSANDFNASNVSNAMLGLGLFGTSALREEVVAYMRGVDTSESDWKTNPTSRKSLGGAPHGVPAIVTYGGTVDNAEQVIFMPTNDGFLHAIDAATGQELWAFVPTETMNTFYHQYQAPSTAYIGYGLDASVVAHVASGDDVDIDTNDASEHAWLFFGMRRGGKAMYALDVTDKTAPRVMWRITGGDLDADGDDDEDFHYLAQTWSQPQLATLRMGSEDTDGTRVAIFGGGYDADKQDSAAAGSGYIDDAAGNAVFIVDAEDGDLLWWAGPTDSNANIVLGDLKSSIAADIEVKDMNEDGFADVLFAADLGGRIFRFDIDNIANTSSSLAITGGMIASLGGGADSSSLTANRKFFAKPDVVLAARGGAPYLAISIGSGERERPKSNLTTENWLFSIKDPYVYDTPSDYNYGIEMDDLYDVTANLIQEGDADEAAAALAALRAADGWKLKLESNPGEKALAEATTFDYRVFFTTFDPVPLDDAGCNAEPGTARLYAVDLITAAAVHDYDGNGLTVDDRATVMTHNTVPPPVTIIFIEDPDTGEVHTTGRSGLTDDEPPLDKTGNVRKTYWYIQSDDIEH